MTFDRNAYQRQRRQNAKAAHAARLKIPLTAAEEIELLTARKRIAEHSKRRRRPFIDTVPRPVIGAGKRKLVPRNPDWTAAAAPIQRAK